METVLLVTASQKAAAALEQMLNNHVRVQVATANSAALARQMLLEREYDLVLINAPLNDEMGSELAMDIASNTTCGVILLVKSELFDEMAHRMEDYGVWVVAKPINKLLFFEAIRFLSATRKRLLGLQKENAKLQDKMEELRLISRAKCVLVQYLNLTEPQAHHYIERQAMDLRTTRREVALSILKMYES